MNVVRTQNIEVVAAVNNALSELAYATSWGERVYVTLPLYYPSGSAVSLSVEVTKYGFIVTDSGLAYKELEMVGCEGSFSRNLRIVSEDAPISITKHEIYGEGNHEELAPLLAEIASASTRLAWKTLSNFKNRKHDEISAYMSQRLEVIFGPHRVEREASLVGPSTRHWRVDAVVHLENHMAVFQAVANSHMSVYPTSAMFHDLALMDTPPAAISVVNDKRSMGNLFNILAQAGNVIESAQGDLVYRSAVDRASSLTP